MDKNQTEDVMLSVVVPTYNDGPLLTGMAEGLSAILDESVGKGLWQFVIVSNGCKDNTPEIIDQLTQRWPTTRAVQLEKPDYGNALRMGLKASEGQWTYIVNVDHWESEFFLWAWQRRQSYDMFIGSRRGDPSLDNRPKYRKFLTWGLNTALQIFFGVVVTDTHGQKLMNMRILKPILDQCVMSRGQFDTEFVIRSQRKGLKLAELPVPISEQRKQRNLMIKKISQNVIDIFRLKKVMSQVPSCSGIHYHRFSRFDLNDHQVDELQTTETVEHTGSV